MSLFSIFAVYFVIWWLCLFVVLPFGVKSQQEGGDVVPGTEPGAPQVPMLVWKLIATSLLALIVMGLVVWGLSNSTLQEYWR